VKVAKDPFTKVKNLIQQLIERLLDESRMDATKKGFCDESLGKAEHDRDSRFMETRDLNRAIASLEAKEDELTEEIDHLTKSISDAEDLLKKTTEDREEEKADNIKTLKTAKQGYASVTEALALLKQFYSSAARASAALVQASPIDEDTSGPGFSGSYKGKQGGMKAVFALLETIQSDFDRTIRKTEEAEGSAHRDHVSFVQATKSQIASESTKKELDEQDLKSTKTNIKAKYADMQANMDLLDDALQELEALKPTCIDTGMSYKDRVAKREDEMAALKKALCILDTDKKEAECA
jgi:peptidoglycan hydrolase CwlO-like protein